MSEFGENLNFFADRQRDQINRTGLNVQYTFTRSNYPTLSIELAPIVAPGQSAQWKDKITLQLTRKELFVFVAACWGILPEFKTAFHGEARNKSLAAHHNGTAGIGIVISEQGRTLQHFLDQADRMELRVFGIRRLAMAWGLSPSDALALLKEYD